MKTFGNSADTTTDTANNANSSAADLTLLTINADPAIAKLDADYYHVNDMDGVAESLFGSGNLNYLTLQSQQNDLAGMATQVSDFDQKETSIANLGSGLSAAHGIESLLQQQESDPVFGGGDTETNAEGNTSSAAQIALPNLSATTQTPPATTTSGASPTDIDSAVRSVSSGFTDRSSTQTAIDGHNGTDGASGHNGTDGATGTNGSNGTNGADGTGGGGDINIVNNNTLNLSHIVDVDVLNNVLNHIDLNLLNNTNILQNIDISILNNVTGPVTNILVDIGDTITNILNPGGGGGNGDTDLHIDLGVIGPININPILDVVLDPIEAVVGDIDGLLGIGSTPGDTDLHVDLSLSGIVDINPVVDVLLDPVEALVGDIDIDILPDINITPDGAVSVDLDVNAIAANIPLVDLTPIHLDIPTIPELLADPSGSVQDILSDADTTVQNLVGDLGGILGSGDTGADTDLNINLGGNLPAIDIPLDPIEAVVGDIDINVLPDLGITPDGGVSVDLDLNGVLAGTPLPGLPGIHLDVPAINDIGGLLDGGDDTVDTDLHIGLGNDIPPIDIPLDPIEAITGDIDLNIIHDIGINDQGGLSVTPELNISLGGTTLVDTGGITLDIPPVSGADITDTVSSTLDHAIDTLSNGGGLAGLQSLGGLAVDTVTAVATTPLPAVENIVDTVWPTTPVNNVIDTVFSLTSASDTASALPAPIGTVAEGLGILSGLTDHHTSSGSHHGLGGLFG